MRILPGPLRRYASPGNRYTAIYFKVQNREEAEDITQETMPERSRSLGTTGSGGPHLGFLRSVALNVLRDRWRRKKRIGPIVSIYGTESNMAVDDIAEQSAIRSMVREALDCLTQEHRTVIELRILKGFSTAETAEIMNKKEGTVRVILYRAPENLQKSWTRIIEGGLIWWAASRKISDYIDDLNAGKSRILMNRQMNRIENLPGLSG